MTTLEQLEARVAALEADEAVDQLNPNVLTIAANGTIGANFTGKVHALELDLDAAPATTPRPASAINWLTTAAPAGFVTEQIQGASTAGGAEELDIIVNPRADTNTGGIVLAVNNGLGATLTRARLRIQRAATDALTFLGFDLTTAAGVTTFYTLIDALTKSSFLQLDQPRKSGVGVATLTWNGASAFSSSQVGGPPVATGVIAVAGNVVTAGAGFVDSGSVSVFPAAAVLQGKTTGGGTPPAGSTCPVYYLYWV